MRIVTVLFFVLGAGLLAGAGFLWRNKATFAAQAIRADGVVVDLNYQHRSNSSRKGKRGSFHPEVEFKTADGKVVRFTGSAGANPPAYKRGDHVAVIYHANAPENARLDSFLDNWLGVLILGGVGLVFAVVAGSTIGLQRRTRPDSR